MKFQRGAIGAIALSLVLILAVGCGGSTTPNSLNSGVVPQPPVYPTPIYTPSTEQQAQQLTQPFSQTTNAATSGTCQPSTLYYPQTQQTYQGMPYNQVNNLGQGAYGGSLVNPSPALQFMNNQLNNGSYQPQQQYTTNGYAPTTQYNNTYNTQYQPITNQGFYPSTNGVNCMNGLGAGSASIAQVSNFYLPEDIRTWLLQLAVYLYFSSSYQSPGVPIGGGAGAGLIYFPSAQGPYQAFSGPTGGNGIP